MKKPSGERVEESSNNNEYCLNWDNHGNSCNGCRYKPTTGNESGTHSDYTWTQECADVRKSNGAPYIDLNRFSKGIREN